MIDLNIYCAEVDFSSLCKAFDGEVEATCPLAVDVVFVDEEEIRRLNAEYRNIDKVTDVLSFPSLDGILGKTLNAQDFPYDIDEEGKLWLGSVAICLNVAEEQAKEYGHSTEREIFYLTVHGMCHLLGYDHEEESDKAVMRQKEERILEKLGLSRG